MNKLYIINDEYFDFNSNQVIIGGLFSYINCLADLGIRLGYDVTVYQLHHSKLELKYNNYNIVSFPLKKYNVQKIYNEVSDKNAIIIISTDQISVKNLSGKTITIQHGIAFDKPREYELNSILRNRYFSILLKLARILKNITRYNRAKHLVCVDYNYYNWLKIATNINDITKFHIIPNFCEISYSELQIKEKLHNKKKTKKILFARRFVDYRGVLIFSNAVKKLLLIHDNLLFTFAGDGHYELFLKDSFKNNKHVNFIKFTQSNSISIHFEFDIVIIPSLYSEGTSLSLLEAMSAGCFPIASIVGGLTNIIINNFNGILIKPTEEDIIESINNVLEMDTIIFDDIVLNAYKTANMSFSKTNWESRWTNLLNKT